MAVLLEPFSYMYMIKAIWVSALVGGVCAFLSAYIMLKGWSLIGNALGHAIVPGVVLSYLLKLPYGIGAFFAGTLGAFSMVFLKHTTKLREDTIVGIIFTSFLAVGLLLISINPVSVNINSIILGNILAISNEDIVQVVLLSGVSLLILIFKWKDFMLMFFDEIHAQGVGIRTDILRIVFFALLSAAAIAALQTVGSFLVIAMLVIPGSTAYMLTDRFGKLIITSVFIGVVTSALGAYLSYFLNMNPGGLIIVLQTILFLTIFMFAPKHGFVKAQLSIARHKKHV